MTFGFLLMVDPNGASGKNTSLELQIDGALTHINLVDGELIPGRGPSSNADFRIVVDTPTLIGLINGEIETREAVEAGDFKIQGDSSVMPMLKEIFPQFEFLT